jgi:DNA-binding transcriptional ArsR family regulator
MPIHAVDDRRLYRQIADQLAALIASGELARGQRLPSERDLAAQMGVSRPSVREALIALEVAGLVRVRGWRWHLRDGGGRRAAGRAHRRRRRPFRAFAGQVGHDLADGRQDSQLVVGSRPQRLLHVANPPARLGTCRSGQLGPRNEIALGKRIGPCRSGSSSFVAWVEAHGRRHDDDRLHHRAGAGTSRAGFSWNRAFLRIAVA